MPSILDEIVATKRSEIAAAKAALPEAELEGLLRGLRAIRPDPATPVVGLPEDRIPPPKR